MRHAEIIALLTLFACGGASPYLRAQPSDARVNDEAIFQVRLTDDRADEVKSLIRRLGANLWRERIQATDALQEIGAGALPWLQSAYCRTDDLEVRLRIEDIVQADYESFYVYDQFGFLGISQIPVPKTHDDFRQIPDGHLGIQIAKVHAGTGAEAADLQEDDIIYAINDEPIPESIQPGGDFGAKIRGMGPGTQVTLSILRRGRPLRVNATLGHCPEELVKARSIPAIYERLQVMQQHFPTWWARYFGGSACRPD